MAGIWHTHIHICRVAAGNLHHAVVAFIATKGYQSLGIRRERCSCKVCVVQWCSGGA